jgi:hypothetical protein
MPRKWPGTKPKILSIQAELERAIEIRKVLERDADCARVDQARELGSILGDSS